jgi:hypothetical protein
MLNKLVSFICVSRGWRRILGGSVGLDRPHRLRQRSQRKAKAKVGNLREESDVSTDEELEKLASDESSPSPPPASPVKTPRPTPIKNRLRYRAGGQTLTPPSDGDDEGDEEAEDEQEPTSAIDEDTEIGEEDVSTEVEVTPKRLRSGKVVGEDVDIASGDEDDEDEVEDQIIEDNTEDDITAIAADVPEEEADIGADDEDEGDSEETTENGRRFIYVGQNLRLTDFL